MKKYLLMLAALSSLTLFSCKDNTPAKENSAASNAEPKVEQTTDANEAPKPTGDVEKDAKACCDYIVALIDDTDLTDKASGEKIEKEIEAFGEAFDKYYEEKGQTKEWEAAGEKYKETIENKFAEITKALEELDKALDEVQ